MIKMKGPECPMMKKIDISILKKLISIHILRTVWNKTEQDSEWLILIKR